MVAKTLFGFEDLLERELNTPWSTRSQKRCSKWLVLLVIKGLCIKPIWHLRTAIKILKPIKTFKVIKANRIYIIVGL